MRESNFKKTRLCICVFMALSLVMISSALVRAEGEEDKPTASIYTDILSQYVWRGFGLSQNSAIIQPSMTASYKGFSLNVWGNFDTNAKPPGSPPPYKGATWNETDLTFSYTHAIVGDLSGSIGGIYYAYDSALDSFEVYGGLSYAFPWLTVGVTGYREVSHYPGWFVQFDLSRNFKLPWCGMSTDLGASFFYLSSSDSTAYPADFDNQGQPIDNGSAFSGMLSGQLAAALNIPIGKYVTVSPRIGYAFPLSSNATNVIRYVSWDGVQNHVFGGLRIAASF